MSDPETILVRAPNWLGDLVMSTPGFRALRARFPRARVSLHVRPGLEPIVAGAPWFDEVLPVQSYRSGVRALLGEAGRLRRRGGWELGVCIPDSFSSALLMRAAGVRRVVGFSRGGRAFLLHEPVDPSPSWGEGRMVARERFVLDLMTSLGCAERGTELELFTTAAEEAEAARLLSARSGGGLPVVAIAPGASFGPSKHWPAESFARVGDRAVEEGAEVVLIGSPAEAPLTKRVADAMSSSATDLGGALDLGALKAVLRRSAVLVCNDAGARHVAVAFGVPCVVLFGPTSVDKTNYNLEGVSVLEADNVSCRPCYERECPIDHRCMTRITPEDVSRRVSSLLAGASADGAS